MNQLALWLLVVNSADVVLTNDLARFPCHHAARQQVLFHNDRIERLKDSERLHGWSNGFWQSSIEDLEKDREWWELLAICTTSGDFRDLYIARFRKLTGEFAFRHGIYPVPLEPLPRPKVLIMGKIGIPAG